MTDQEYIQAFRRNEQSVISAFYTQNKERFITHIGRKFHILDRDTLFDVYQDSIWRLWEKIQQDDSCFIADVPECQFVRGH